jgi:hypothetical protein
MPHVASYITLVHEGEQRLAESMGTVGRAQHDESEVLHGLALLADLSRQNVAALAPHEARHRERREEEVEHEPEDFFAEPVAEAREGPIGLLRDLQDLLALATFVQSSWTVVQQGARAMKDEELKAVCQLALGHNEQQCRWLRTHLKLAAPQALLLGG